MTETEVSHFKPSNKHTDLTILLRSEFSVTNGSLRSEYSPTRIQKCI